MENRVAEYHLKFEELVKGGGQMRDFAALSNMYSDLNSDKSYADTGSSAAQQRDEAARPSSDQSQ